MKAKEITLELKKLTSAIKVCHLAWAGLIAGQIVSPSAQAAPEGGTVVGGEGSINTSDLTTIIDQKTDLLAIDWESFNLTEEEIVKFLQPGSSSVVLNRILDENPSDIRGSIEANGHVILANPRGVLFTETATVNVGAITAAGLDINPQEFMNGNFAFEGEDGSAGVVVNRGLINAASAVLVGKQVTNAASGLISAEMVSLAAADEAVLTFDADGLIGVKVTKEVMENQMGLDSAVLNEGAIEGTTVLMEASVSGDLFTAAVNNEGTVQARGIDTSGGKIRLFGSGSGVVNSGTLDASGTQGGEVTIEGDSATHSGQIAVSGNAGEGGLAQVLGDEVTVSGDIDARGTASGGEVLIGGDYRGENDAVRNATTTVVTAEADINASGIDNGDGGKVIVWADDTTQFGGTIRAESGEFGGDGGFVETSGKVNLHLDEDTMFVSTLSLAGGETGEWLLDPEWFSIGGSCDLNCISDFDLVTALRFNNVNITVSGDGASVIGDGESDLTNDQAYTRGILVSSDLTWESEQKLILESFKDIQIEDGVSISSSKGTLDLIVGENFTNNGSIGVSTFTLKVGANNNGSENTLGTITGSGTITGGAGLDKFTLTSESEELIFEENSDPDNPGSAPGYQLSLIGADGNITFKNIEEVDTGLGEDSVTGADGFDWELTGTNNQAENNGITFTNVEQITAVNAGLTATDVNETFVVNDSGHVAIYDMTFTGLTAVDGNGGTDALDASAYTAGAELTGSDNELIVAGVSFSNIHSADIAVLTGSGGDDVFDITGNNSLEAAEISFSGVTNVAAGEGNDSLKAIETVTLTGAQNTATTSGITFTGLDAASGGSLEASDLDDIFIVTGVESLTANGIAFSGISSLDAKGGSDSVTGADGIDWELTGTNNQAENNGITFTNVEQITAVNAGLKATSGDEIFVLNADTSVGSYGMTFTGLTAVHGNGGTDALDASGYAAGVALTDTDNELNAGSITFSNIHSAEASALTATSGADQFDITGANSLDVAGISFSGLTAVNGAGGSNVLDASAIATGGELTGTDNQLIAAGITFSNIHSAEITALTGSSGSDHFEVTGVNALKANGIAVNGINTLDAMGGTDSVIGADGIDWLLTGINNRAENSGITFSNVESITALNAGLTGTTADETFTLNSDGSIDSYGMTFTGLTAVDGIGGTDALDASAYAAGVALTDTDNQLSAGGITFSNIFSADATVLSGSSGNDQFEVTGVNALTANGIAFSEISSLDAMDGNDSVIGADGIDWQLTGINKQAENSGITFTNVELITAVNAGLTATSVEETFVLNANGSVGSYGMTFTGLTAVDGVDGDDSLDASAYASGVALTGTDHQLSANGINFSNIHSAQASDLTGTSGADQFDITGTNSLDVAGISFSGLSNVDAGSGTDELAADGSVTLSGSLSVTASAIDFANIETVTNTGALTGTDSDDTFSMVAANQLDSYGIRFEDVNSVAAAAGSDHLVGLDSESWQLSGSDNALHQLGIDFTGLESTSGGNGILTGSDTDDQFAISNSNQVTANSITFEDINQVDAGGGTDQVTSPDSATWILGVADGSAEAAGIDFLNIESVAGNDLSVDAVTNNASDNFILSDTGKALSIRGIDFSSVSAISAGDDSGDSVTSNASEWLLTGTDGALSVNGVELSGIDRVITSNALLRGTDSGETFALSGENALEVAAIAFEGISQVIAGGGSDLLQGTADADHFELADNGDISAAAINFSGIETVAAGEGEDTVGAGGANWTSVLSGDALVEGSARATVNSITVLFENLEQVNNADAYTGQDIDSEYTFSSLDTVTVAGVTFAGLSSFTAGSGVDVLRGADIDAQWFLDDEQGSITSGAQSMLFSGVESIVAGSGADQFTLTGGVLEALDTGAGNDSVQLAGTRLQALYLGEGNDYLQVDADSSQNLQLSGGSGDDEFQLNVAEKTWQINGANTRVGNFQLSGFEWLDNNTNSLALETDQNFIFVNGGDSSANFNRNGAGILFADSGLRLGYDGSGDISIISTGIDTITGDLKANRAALVVAGNVDIETDVNVLDIHSSVGDIDISVLAKKDLVIDEINAGRGNIVINSKSFGSLTAETYGDTHLTAGKVRLGDELQQWTVIGSAVNPLRMDVSESVDIVAISYFEPDFIRQIPAFSATGDELQSVAGAQTAQGLKSAVQNAVEDFAQVDPGIFTEVYPYSTGVDAVNTPEMRLKGDQLLPVVDQPEEDEEDGPLNRAAELGSISSGSRKGPYTGVGTVGAGR
ncbi:filamentous hemagglutinin N-terminal domain-containing protein [Microbulbifer thermotolerans]|uniref:two-partner secretion domain-containing protein n=1 Tax=Microbulbifer thermotolerans TaxID=252514 RepID=UPI00224AD44B|nr:filamentous hemagglutinin N-terminal domain-containing protein [Microbulbifer thermotolerans]MCX2782037.1 filamentous hemagglutinin N-terminal domain-containing protein [Microbulbifer thermotolerans]